VVTPDTDTASRLFNPRLRFDRGKVQNLQAEFRRLSQIWSHKEFADFERAARKEFSALSVVRQASLTPPEFCFLLARRKIQKGHYTRDT
jgi:hypothetical protein